MEQIRDGYFSPENPDQFKDIYNSLAFDDRFLLCADYADYLRAQQEVEEAYKVSHFWGIFSVTLENIYFPIRI
ncbi:unnamed protein product [Trichobilharzia regenti]|nr:unnamed protein product [Trichobilharzia regenti]